MQWQSKQLWKQYPWQQMAWSEERPQDCLCLPDEMSGKPPSGNDWVVALCEMGTSQEIECHFRGPGEVDLCCIPWGHPLLPFPCTHWHETQHISTNNCRSSLHLRLRCWKTYHYFMENIPLFHASLREKHSELNYDMPLIVRCIPVWEMINVKINICLIIYKI